MILDFLIVADAAAAERTKLYIHGGGLTRITPPSLPWAQPLAFCIRLVFDQDEDLATPHQISLELVDPDGTTLLTVPAAPLPKPSEETWLSGEERALGVAVNASVVQFSKPGAHVLRLWLDGVIQRTTQLVVAPPGAH